MNALLAKPYQDQRTNPHLVPAADVAGVGRRAGAQGRPVLEVIELTKAFAGATVVDRLSFDLRAGEVLGFLGPNGAGKSTTVGMILGLIRPTEGIVKIAGEALAERPALVAEQIGAIIENPAFYPYLTGRDNLRAFALMTGGVDEARISSLLKLVNMDHRADRPYKTFSLGMKQRLGIAATLLTDPAIVILDEPTNGLDPAGQREIREIIPRLAAEGHAVLLASHLLHEVEQVCDRVAIIRRGRLIESGRVADLVRRGAALEVVLPPADLERGASGLRDLPFVESVTIRDGVLVVAAPEERGADVNRALAGQGLFASAIVPRRSSLEDIFLELTEGSTPGEQAESAPGRRERDAAPAA